MTDIFKQIQDSIEGILEQDFLPEHFKGRKLSDLNDDELMQVNMIINNHNFRTQNEIKEIAREKAVGKLKEEGAFCHIWMIKLNSRTVEMLEKLAEQRGYKHTPYILNDLIEKELGLFEGESLPKTHKKS